MQVELEHFHDMLVLPANASTFYGIFGVASVSHTFYGTCGVAYQILAASIYNPADFPFGR
jgi:hypothetical protein